jgi:hypothetical protein
VVSVNPSGGVLLLQLLRLKQVAGKLAAVNSLGIKRVLGAHGGHAATWPIASCRRTHLSVCLHETDVADAGHSHPAFENGVGSVDLCSTSSNEQVVALAWAAALDDAC